MSDPLTQYWRGASTVNVVWFVRFEIKPHDDVSGTTFELTGYVTHPDPKRAHRGDRIAGAVIYRFATESPFLQSALNELAMAVRLEYENEVRKLIQEGLDSGPGIEATSEYWAEKKQKGLERAAKRYAQWSEGEERECDQTLNEVLDCQDEQIQGLSQRCDELEAQVHALQCDLRAEKAEIHKLLTRNRDLIRDNAVLENALVTIKRWIDTGQFDAEACRQWIISHIGKAKK